MATRRSPRKREHASTQDRTVLPTEVAPHHYDIKLYLDFDKCTFHGSEVVELSLKNPVDRISLHAIDLEMKNVFVRSGSQEYRPKGKPLFEEHTEDSHTFIFAKNIPKGKATFHVEFSGTMGSSMVGLYKSQYSQSDEQFIYPFMATTQFEATDARRAFPCWDEPLLKATFKLSLVFPKSLCGISNMPILKEEPAASLDGKADYQCVEFDTTPTMSTYLLAFCVGEFDSVEDATPEGVQVRVFCTRGKQAQCELALTTAVKCLSFYGNYFEIHYPLPKLDMIGVPDFAAGAMENWGLVTYRETSLFCLQTDPVSSKKGVVFTVAHELAHQWFGNLVTMEWWDDLWLNEGFATWMSYLATDHLHPDWESWTHFSQDEYKVAMNLDALMSSHPVQCPVKKSSEVNQIFDTISYCKGSCVIKMLVDYMGLDTFQSGIRLYLRKHQYKNAITTDLWDSLSEVSGKPIEKLMHSYTRQTGYPLVTVKEVSHASDDSFRKIQVSQKRFLQSPPAGKSSQLPTTRWWIPLTLLIPADANHRKGESHRGEGGSHSGIGCERHLYEIDKKEQVIQVPKRGGDERDWIKFNVEQAGIYRVCYSLELSRSLMGSISESGGDHVGGARFSVTDRLNILNDTFALTKSGDLSIVDLMDTLRAFEKEGEYLLWSEIFSILHGIGIVWGHDEETVTLLDKFAVKLFSGVSERFSVDEKEETDKGQLFRYLVFRAMTYFGSQKYIDIFVSKFKLLEGDLESVDSDLRPICYSTVAERVGDSYDVLFCRMQSAVGVDKCKLLSSLGHFRAGEDVLKTMRLLLGDRLRSQDSIFPMRGLSTNRYAGVTGWEYFKSHYGALQKRYGSGNMSYLGGFVKNLTSTFCTVELAEDVESFFATHSIEAGRMDVDQAIETIRHRAIWRQRDGENLLKYLRGLDL